MKNKRDKKFYKRLLTIGLPIVVQNFMFTLVNMVDTIMIGQLGEEQIAGVGAGNRLFFLFNLIIFGINSGGAIFLAQYWGIKDVKNIRRVLGFNSTLSIISGAIFTGIALLIPQSFLWLFNKDPEVIAAGTRYLRVVCFSYMITSISFSFTFALRSIGKTVVPMITNGVALLLNMIFSATFIFGLFGAPEMGVAGAALGTVLARSIEIVLLFTIIYVRRGPLAAKVSDFFDWNRDLLRKVSIKMLPVVSNEFIWSLGVTLYGVYYGALGKHALAAMTILSTVEQLGMVLFFGMGSASAVMLGNALGANESDKAWSYAKKFAYLGPSIAVVIGLGLIAFTPLYMRVYNVDSTVIDYVKGCIMIYAFIMPFKVFNTINIVGVLRSGGDTIFSLILDAAGVWGVGIPLGAIGVYILGLDLYPVYFLVLCEELFKFFLGVWRFRSKKWINNLVNG